MHFPQEKQNNYKHKLNLHIQTGTSIYLDSMKSDSRRKVSRQDSALDHQFILFQAQRCEHFISVWTHSYNINMIMYKHINYQDYFHVPCWHISCIYSILRIAGRQLNTNIKEELVFEWRKSQILPLLINWLITNNIVHIWYSDIHSVLHPYPAPVVQW